MNDQLQNFLKKAKDFERGQTLYSQTFVGELFKESYFYFYQNDSVSLEKPTKTALLKTTTTKPVAREKNGAADRISKVAFIGENIENNEAGELLTKMIQAMKLAPNEFCLFGATDEDFSDLNCKNAFKFKVIAELKNMKPDYVVLLGATISQIFLDQKDKMSQIHGKFFPFHEEECDWQYMPIFHPSFLLINPNMKRAAWMDLQLIMQALGKI